MCSRCFRTVPGLTKSACAITVFVSPAAALARTTRSRGVRRSSLIRAAAVYVATTGNDANPGTKAAPKKTVQAGIAAAAAMADVPDVYVSAGTYDESGGLALASGVNLDGGYTAV